MLYVEHENLDNVLEWFRNFNGTDENYLRGHYERYQRTLQFALDESNCETKLDILDIGCHWLHNTFFYSNRGHRVVATDAPDLMDYDSVVTASKAMNAVLLPSKRLETGNGISELEENSIDLVLFCEIIEHLAFNPIPLWKQIYRVLRPGGRIIVTTPNSMYHRSIDIQLNRALSGSGFGISINDIMSNGTYGHHWKEFSILELKEYFNFLSADFDTSRFEMITLDFDKDTDLSSEAIEISKFTDVRAHNIYLEVKLNEKLSGIQVDPPWIPK